MKMRFGSLLRLLVWIPALSFSQNLVSNAGFENYNKCPQSLSDAGYFDQVVPGWYSASLGTPDYFNRCGNEITRVPDNWAGVAEPKSGNGYAGIYIWNNSKTEIREYLQARMLKSFEAGKLYKVSFSFCLSTYSMFGADEIGAYFSTQPFFENSQGRIDVNPQISVKRYNTTDHDLREWQVLTDTFRAKGNETFITLGNFRSNAQTKVIELKSRKIQEEMLKDKAYYYLDNISVEEVPSQNHSLNSNNYSIGKIFTIDHVEFEYKKSILKDSSYIPLKSLARYLVDHPYLKVEISGHTDTVGGKEFNLDLSYKRAQAVVNYLVLNKVDMKQMHISGYGSSKPLESNATEQGRIKNRRVEFLLVK